MKPKKLLFKQLPPMVGAVVLRATIERHCFR